MQPVQGCPASAPLSSRTAIRATRAPEGHGPLEDLYIFAKPAVFAAQLRQLPPLRGREPAVLARARVTSGLLDPLAHRSLGQIEVPGDLANRPVTPLAQLNDPGLELRVNERLGRGFFLPMLSMAGQAQSV